MTATSNFRDGWLVFKLSCLGWLVASAAGIGAAVWLFMPAAPAWTPFILSKISVSAGVMDIAWIPVSDYWLPANNVVAWAEKTLPTSTVREWESHLKIFILIPPSLAVFMALAWGLIFVNNSRKAGSE